VSEWRISACRPATAARNALSWRKRSAVSVQLYVVSRIASVIRAPRDFDISENRSPERSAFRVETDGRRRRVSSSSYFGAWLIHIVDGTEKNSPRPACVLNDIDHCPGISRRLLSDTRLTPATWSRCWRRRCILSATLPRRTAYVISVPARRRSDLCRCEPFDELSSPVGFLLLKLFAEGWRNRKRLTGRIETFPYRLFCAPVTLVRNDDDPVRRREGSRRDLVPQRPACGSAGRAAGTRSCPLRSADGSGGRRNDRTAWTLGGATLLCAVRVQSIRVGAHRPWGPGRRREGGLQQSGVCGRVVDARRLLRGVAAESPLLHQVSTSQPSINNKIWLITRRSFANQNWFKVARLCDEQIFSRNYFEPLILILKKHASCSFRLICLVLLLKKMFKESLAESTPSYRL